MSYKVSFRSANNVFGAHHMNCDFCDTALASDANFCNRCGNAIGEHRNGRLEMDGPGGTAGGKGNSFLGSMMRSGLTARVIFSTVAYGLLGLWAGSLIPMVSATTLGMLGAAYGALRKI